MVAVTYTHSLNFPVVYQDSIIIQYIALLRSGADGLSDVLLITKQNPQWQQNLLIL